MPDIRQLGQMHMLGCSAERSGVRQQAGSRAAGADAWRRSSCDLAPDQRQQAAAARGSRDAAAQQPTTRAPTNLSFPMMSTVFGGLNVGGRPHRRAMCCTLAFGRRPAVPPLLMSKGSCLMDIHGPAPNVFQTVLTEEDLGAAL